MITQPARRSASGRLRAYLLAGASAVGVGAIAAGPLGPTPPPTAQIAVSPLAATNAAPAAPHAGGTIDSSTAQLTADLAPRSAGVQLSLLTGTPNLGADNVGVFNTGVANDGVANTGVFNVGDFNIGGTNTGDFNIGLKNKGDFNIGAANAGDFNVGAFNTGVRNFGIGNSGTLNIGLANSGRTNVGVGNTGVGDVGFFNSTAYTIGVLNLGIHYAKRPVVAAASPTDVSKPVNTSSIRSAAASSTPRLQSVTTTAGKNVGSARKAVNRTVSTLGHYGADPVRSSVPKTK